MPCYHPLRAALVEGPQGRSISFNRRSRGKGLSLPCGRCIGCRLERSRQWAVRIMHESELHQCNCFLTLTYKNVPFDGSLNVEDCQKFLKRLRAKLDPIKVRFFLCGEYGENLSRPHYHAIIFGYDFPDKVPCKQAGDYCLYESELLNSVWGHGLAWIGEVSFESASYVANYATKKITGDKSESYYCGRRPEFLLMSRRPGIGRGWIDKFRSDVYPSDEVIVREHSTRPPRYYDNVFKAADPELHAEVSKRREAAMEKLEDLVLKSGDVVRVAPSCNIRRLVVRERVACAKLALKTRKLESANA